MNNHRVCNVEYDNELNQRLNTRYFPSQTLKPNFDPRPVQTKYTLFQTLEEQPNANVSLNKYNNYTTKDVFYPGNSKAPVDFALDNVDVESLLRNQYFALQKNDRAYYIPNVDSILYEHHSHLADKPKKEEFKKVNFKVNVDKCNLAPNNFNNSTRYNLKNL